MVTCPNRIALNRLNRRSRNLQRVLNPQAEARKRGGPGFKGLGRAIRYLGHYRRTTYLAYFFLVISVGAQLMVPQLVQNAWMPSPKAVSPSK